MKRSYFGWRSRARRDRVGHRVGRRTLVNEALESRQLLAGAELPDALVGTVFFDADGDQSVSSGEAIAGAKLEIYLDDGDGVFSTSADSNDRLIGEVTTATDGTYRSGALDPDGGYFVVLPNQGTTERPIDRQVSSLLRPSENVKVVDAFQSAQRAASDIFTMPTDTSTLEIESGEVLGGERDLLVRGQASLVVDANGLTYRRGATGAAGTELAVVWDGVDGDGATVARGLNDFDLTNAGLYSALVIRASAENDGQEFSLRLYNEDQTTLVVAELPQADDLQEFDSVVIPFADFEGAVSPTQVDALEMKFDLPMAEAGRIRSIAAIGSYRVDFSVGEQNEVNLPPLAEDDFYVISDGDRVSISSAGGLLANDVDPELAPLTVIEVVEPPQLGEITLNEDGSFQYQPNGAGTDRFVYRVQDDEGQTATASVTIVVQAANQPPVAAEDFYEAREGELLRVASANGLLANDLELDGETITMTRIVEGPILGAVTATPDGSFEYEAITPGTDQFTYEVSDESGMTAIGTVTIVVEAVALPEVELNADIYQAVEQTTLLVRAAQGVLANDSTAAVVDLRVELVDLPRHGSISLNADGGFEYVPNTGFVGTDMFTYRVRGNDLVTEAETVSIEVAHDTKNRLIRGQVFDPASDDALPLGDVLVHLYLDDGDSSFDADIDELLYETVTDHEGRYAFSALDLNRDYFVVQPAQQLGESIDLTRLVSDRIRLSDFEIVIDQFQSTQSVVARATGDRTGFDALESELGELEVIGGERELIAQIESEAGAVQLASNLVGAAPGLLFETTAGAAGTGTIIWDGVDDDATLAAGLSARDLTDGGRLNGILIDLVGQTVGGFATLRIHDFQAGEASEAMIPIATDFNSLRYVPFQDFVGAASPSSVDAIELVLRGNADGGEIVAVSSLGVVGNPVVDFGLESESGDANVDIAVSLTNESDSIIAGLPTAYTLVVQNLGERDVADVALSFQLPNGVSDLTFSSNVTSGVTGNTEFGDNAIEDQLFLPAGALATYTLLVQTDPGLLGTLQLEATATTPATVVDIDDGNNRAMDEDDVSSMSELSITVTNEQTELLPSQQVVYVVTVRNEGPSDALGAQVLTQLPVQLNEVTFTSSGSEGVVGQTTDGTESVNDIVDLPAGAVLTYRVSGVVASDAAGQVMFQAEVEPSNSTIDNDSSNNQALDVDSVSRQTVDVVVEASGGFAEAAAGETVEYVVTVRNQGGVAVDGVALSGSIANAFHVVEIASVAMGDATGNTALIQVRDFQELLMLPAGGSVEYTFKGTTPPTSSGSVESQFAVTLPDHLSDEDETNNSLTIETVIVASTDIGVVVDSDAAEVSRGELVEYVVDVFNNGPSDAQNVSIVAELPVGLENVSFVVETTDRVTRFTPQGQGAINETVDIQAGGSIRYRLTGTVANNAEAAIQFSASVSPESEGDDPVRRNNNAIEIDSVRPPLLTNSVIAGHVFVDGDEDGSFDSDEFGIVGVLLFLTGTNDDGVAVNRTATTDAEGRFEFRSLPPGVYEIQEQQPTGFQDGEDMPGNDGEIVENDVIRVVLSEATQVVDLSFAEIEPVVIPIEVDLVVSIFEQPEEIIAGEVVPQPIVLRLQNLTEVGAVETVVTGTLADDVEVTASNVVGDFIRTAEGYEWTIGEVEAGASIDLTLHVVVAADVPEQEVLHRVAVQSTADDVDLSNNVASGVLPVATRSDVALEFHAPTSTVAGGDPEELRLSVTNSGPSVARDLELVWTLDDVWEIQQADSSSGDFEREGSTARWRLERLDPTQTVSFDVLARAVASARAGESVSHARLQSSSTRLSPDAFPSTLAATRIENDARVEISVSDSIETVESGFEGASYEIVVSNTGPSEAVDFTVRGRVPRPFIQGDFEAERGVVEMRNGELVWEFNSLPPHTSARLRVPYRVPVDAVSSEAVIRLDLAWATRDQAARLTSVSDVTRVQSDQVPEPPVDPNEPTEPEPTFVTGTVFQDRDADGFMGPGESGLAGWQVYVDENENDQLDATERDTLTDANGRYRLEVEAGETTVAVVPQTPWQAVSPTNAWNVSSTLEQPTQMGVSMDLGDLDGDGREEIILVDEVFNQVLLYEVSANGTMESWGRLQTGKRPRAVALVDADRDDDLDIVVATVGGAIGADARNNGLTLWLNNGSGQFRESNSVSVGDGPQELALADVDGDQNDELIAVTIRDGRVSVVDVQQSRLRVREEYHLGGALSSVTPIDLTGDGASELAVTDSRNHRLVIVGRDINGLVIVDSLDVGNGPSSVVAGDWNSDGTTDLAVANYLDDTLWIVRNADGQLIVSGQRQLAEGARPSSLVVVDLNRDDLPDLVAVNREASTVTPLINVEGTLMSGRDVSVGNGPQALTGYIFRETQESRLAVSILGGSGAVNSLQPRLVLIEPSAFVHQLVVGEGETVTGRDFGFTRLEPLVLPDDLVTRGGFETLVSALGGELPSASEKTPRPHDLIWGDESYVATVLPIVNDEPDRTFDSKRKQRVHRQLVSRRRGTPQQSDHRWSD